jgi:hypothetical protein
MGKSTFTDSIRDAILAAKARGVTRARLSKLTGIAESNLCDFTVRRLMGISSASLDKIAPLLGLSLAVDEAAQRRTAALPLKPTNKRRKPTRRKT